MRIFLPWQLVVVLTLFLNASSESELSVTSTDPNSSEAYDYGDTPLPLPTSEYELPNPSTDPTPIVTSDSKTLQTSESELPNPSTETSEEKPPPTKFSTLQYGSACINIYDSRTTSNNKIIFFYSPIAQLNHKDTVFFFNETVNQGLISLSYSIWNEVVGIKVARYLTKALNQEVEPNQVKVFPFDSVRLTSITQSSGDFSLTNEWLTYKDEQSLRFSVTCPTFEDCDQVNSKIRSNPEQFEDLKLYFSPQWSDNYCSPDVVKISQEDELSIQVEELKKRLEETKLNFTKELTVTLENFEITKNELTQTKVTVEEWSAKLNETNQKLLDNIETRLTKDLDAIREGNSKILQKSANASAAMADLKTEQKGIRNDLEMISQLLANQINVTEENLAVTLKHFNTTGNELNQAKATVEELSAKLKGNSEILQKSTNASQVAVENLKTEQKETKLGFAKMSQVLANKINATEGNLAVTLENLEMTRKELAQTKTFAGELSVKLNVTLENLETTKNELTQTKVTIEELSSKLKATEKDLAAMKITNENLSTELKANSRRLSYESKVAEDNLRKELRATSNNLETVTKYLNTMRTEFSSTNAVVADLTTKLNARTSEIVDIGKMPTSCGELERMGHKLSGFFSVKGSKKLETVFCNFYSNQNDKEKWIGYTDVKSTSVHFYVQKDSLFTEDDVPIPFEISVLNVGNAMNLISGIFTAPRKGIYFFSFTGNAAFPSSLLSSVYLRVRLYVNGTKMGVGNVQEANTVKNQHGSFTVQSTLELRPGDRVWLQIDGKSPGTRLHDHNEHKFNHFTGTMLEEEIVASL